MGKITNLANLAVGDLDTSYDVAGGASQFKVPVTKSVSGVLQIIWDGLNGNNASVQLKGSNNDVDFDDLAGASSKQLNPGAGDSHSFQIDQFDHGRLMVDFDPGNSNAGTLKMLWKPRI